MKLYRISGCGSGTWITAILFMAGMLFTSCQKESKGFVLPPGNIEAGRQLFTTLNCTDCHSIGDLAWIGTEAGGSPHVQLGGSVTKLKMYGELVTSVINPSHKISQKSLADDRWVIPGGTSRMESYCYNDVMTVQQLVDIIAFLQSEYKLMMPEYYYPYY